MNEAAMKAFLEAVWRKAQEQGGFPVNAGDIRIFGGGDEVEKQSIRNVVNDCKSYGLLTVTTDGNIHNLSAAGKAFIGVE